MKQRRETICVQGGWKPGNGEPRVLPIYQSTTFKYDSTEQMADLFDLKADGYFYTFAESYQRRSGSENLRIGRRRYGDAYFFGSGSQLLCGVQYL